MGNREFLPKSLWVFIAIVSTIKLIVAVSIDFGNDEVYYWTYALNLKWNYFDHPPFIAWLIRFSTLNLSLHNEIAVRFGAILSSSICTILVFQIGSFLSGNKLAWYAVFLYTASLYCSIISGTFILPDSPQMVFWLWGFFLLLKINRQPHFTTWCWFGLACGLCMLCKIHGVFLWFGALLVTLPKIKQTLSRKGIYVSAGITLLLFSPVIFWNFNNHFITYTYHSERVSFVRSGINPISFFREISGEFLYNNPIVFCLAWWAVFSCITKKQKRLKNENRVILCCSIPLIATLITFALFRDTLPHWSGPAYSLLIFLAAIKLEEMENQFKAKRLAFSALALVFFIIVIGLNAVHFYPGSLAPEKDNLHFGAGDPTLDLYGWPETGEIVKRQHLKDGNQFSDIVVIDKWFPAAHLDFYVCPNAHLYTFGIGEIFDLHEYYWSNNNKKALLKGGNAYYIVPSNLFNADVLATIQSKFKSCSLARIAPIYRNGRKCKNVLIYKLYDRK